MMCQSVNKSIKIVQVEKSAIKIEIFECEHL